MSKKHLIANAVNLARGANWLAIYHKCTGNPAIADVWRQRRAQHIDAARAMKQDAQP